MGLFVLLFLCIFCCSQAIALQELGCDDNEVFNAVDIALKEYNRGRKNGHLFALNVILEASRTEGPGENYLVKYQIRETNCAIGEDISWKKCSFRAASEGDSGECLAEVHIDDSLNLSSVQQTCRINPAPGKVATAQAPCLGCWTRISTKTPELQAVVKHGIELFNNKSDENALFGVKKILTAESQVVAGWNYKVEYSIKTTNCSKAELPLLTPECQAISEGREGICTINAYVHFTNELVSATQDCKLKADEIVPAPVCVGCPVRISIHDPELQEPLAAALEKYNSESQNDFHYAIVQITKATSQVVAGRLYRIDFVIGKTFCHKATVPKLSKDCTVAEDEPLLSCNATIYQRAWEAVLLPTVECMDEQPQEHKGNDLLPSACPGCIINLPTDSPMLQKPLAAALEKLNSERDDDFYYKVKEIITATKQVVAGIKYQIDFVLGKTNCVKAMVPKLKKICTVPEDEAQQLLRCNATIYERAWEAVVSPKVQCKTEQPQEHKGHDNDLLPSVCPSCKINLPTDSPILQKPLAAALEKFNSDSDDDFYYNVEEIITATREVASGIIFRIMFIIKKTNCPKSKFPNLNEGCTTTVDSEPLECNASIYQKPLAFKTRVVMVCTVTQPIQFFQRRPPGFTPFRSLRIKGSTGHTPKKELALGHKRGHGHGHGRHHKKTKKESEESEESREDIQQDFPNQQSNSEPFLEEQVTRNADEDIFPSFGTPDAAISLFQDSSSKPISLFQKLPELPEPPAPKCPGRPWKPITAPTTSLQEDLSDFTLGDLLPDLDEGKIGPHETTTVPQQQLHEDFDLTDALLD